MPTLLASADRGDQEAERLLVELAEEIRPECHRLSTGIERHGGRLASGTAFSMLRDARLRELRNSIPARWKVVSDGLPDGWRSDEGFDSLIWPLLRPRHRLAKVASWLEKWDESPAHAESERSAREEVEILLEALEPAERACSLIEPGLEERISRSRKQALDALESDSPLPAIGRALRSLSAAWAAASRRLVGLPKSAEPQSASAGSVMADPPAPKESLILTELLGTGAHAEVWLGKDELRDQVAVKVLKPAAEEMVGFGLIDQGKALARTEGEAAPHENLVSALYSDYVRHPDSGKILPAVVMRYVPGKPLESWFEEDHAFEPDEALRIGRGVISAISHLHTSCGLTHNDLHAGNVMVGEDVTKVIDILYYGDSLALRSTAGRESRLHRDRTSLVQLLQRLLERSNVPTGAAARFALDAYSQSDIEGIAAEFERCVGAPVPTPPQATEFTESEAAASDEQRLWNDCLHLLGHAVNQATERCEGQVVLTEDRGQLMVFVLGGRQLSLPETNRGRMRLRAVIEHLERGGFLTSAGAGQWQVTDRGHAEADAATPEGEAFWKR